ncbi:response regulator [Niveibacterium sp. SC-1]|uniref:response regulator n=1 Tax=Niveibacterium sp. SC-1 TaxID=3135646 RepID=UPI00311DB87E
MSKPKILVVDDEPVNLEIVSEVLTDLDCSLQTAASGQAALDRLAAEDFDLVLLDRMMPGMDGMAVLRAMKADERLRRLPVIMQTAAAAPEQVREGLAAGAFYYLTKPFDTDTLLSIVRAALQDRAWRMDLVARIGAHQIALQNLDRAEFSIRTLEEAAAISATISLLATASAGLAMGLSELLVNAIEHGNLGIDYAEKGRLKESGTWPEEVERRLALPEHRDKRVRLVIERERTRLHFRIHDEGVGFDWAPFLELDAERAQALNGRGIALARRFGFAGLEYEGCGNTVHAWIEDKERRG